MKNTPSLEDLRKEAEDFLKSHCPQVEISTPAQRRALIWRTIKNVAEKEGRIIGPSELSRVLKYRRSQMCREDLVDMRQLGQLYSPSRGVYIPVGEEPQE